MPPMDHTRAIMHSCGTFLMGPPARGLERLSDSERLPSHGGMSSATAVLSRDVCGVLPVRNNHAESQAYYETFGQTTRRPEASRAYLFPARQQPTCSRGCFALHL